MVHSLRKKIVRKGKRRQLSLRKKMRGGVFTRPGPVPNCSSFLVDNDGNEHKLPSSFNANLIKINDRERTIQCILTTGHSLPGTDRYSIDDEIFTYTQNITDLFTDNRRLHYTINDSVTSNCISRDFSLLHSDRINNSTNTILLNGYKIVVGIKRYATVNIDIPLIKNSANTGITRGILKAKFSCPDPLTNDLLVRHNLFIPTTPQNQGETALFLNSTATKYIKAGLASYFIEPDQASFIQMRDANPRTLQFDNAIVQDTRLRELFKASLTSICKILPGAKAVPNAFFTDALYDNFKNYFSYSSYQGDSGSGWYTKNDGETTELIGINLSGCDGANVIYIHNDGELREENGHICIGHFQIQNFFKGSLVTSVDKVESSIKTIKDASGNVTETLDNIRILDDFTAAAGGRRRRKTRKN